MRTKITYLYKVRRYCLLSSFNCCDVQRYNKSPNRSKFVCFSEVNPLQIYPYSFSWAHLKATPEARLSRSA